MSTRKPRCMSAEVTIKFLPDDATIRGTRYPLTMADLCFTILIKRSGQLEAIGIFIEANHDLEKSGNLTLVNKYSSKSIVGEFTRVMAPRVMAPDWGWVNFITLKSVLDENAGWLDSDGYLTLKATISEPVHNKKIKAESDFIENLLKHARADKNLIVCAGDGTEYKMNEYIFASHSELLSTHLRNKSSGKVVFDSVSADIMDEFIFYLNNGSINESAESVAFDLAELAHMYELNRLFDLVEPFLLKQVGSGQLSRLMKIAKQFSSKPLFKAIGEMEEVSEDLLSDESEDFTVEVHGEALSINQAFLALKHPHLHRHKEEMSAALQGTTLQAAKGFISYLKTSNLDDLSECLFEYATLAQALNCPDISRLVEQELVSNTSKYDRAKVEDLAETLKSVKIFRALAALP